MSKTTVERRTHPRLARTIEIQGAPAEGGELARMTASDLSLGGLYCTSSADFPEMTRLAVRLLLPRPLDLEAVVVRRKQVPSSSGAPRFELALFFVSPTAAQRARLEQFLES
jgi:hypothetical protein